MKIPIIGKYRQSKEYESKSKYKGNETFYITQANPNEELLDYAALYGKKIKRYFWVFKINVIHPIQILIQNL